MWHTLAWTKSVAASTLEELTPVADQVVTITNGRFILPGDGDLLGAIAYATDLQRAKITTPRLRNISPHYIRPIQPTLIGANDANMALWDRTPLRLRGGEEIIVEAFQDNAGAQRVTVVGFLAGPLQPVPAGDVVVIRATSVTAAVANVWSLLTVTFEQSLPQGRWAVVGLEHISANGQAARLTFDMQYYRPGCPSVSDVNQRQPYPWGDYTFGMMGTYVSLIPPRFEVLCNAADAAHEFYLHIVPAAG